ncbi:flagellar motor switch protein FliN [Verticiella sediminum]|uniref:Flagellar motor switch protein FliN n=1 Tax=Verticiella sediminum TaxID=1247510 RepID=A0A556ARV8_9BURK|nr:flagellar motor switch protein FliN [Verticiella sediminum]TSH95667.1 flagellar motor switch protein FliN [Verticiella sediminum]
MTDPNNDKDVAASNSAEDDWASALAEQTAATQAAQAVFQPLERTPAPEPAGGGGPDIDRIMDVPVQLTVELGRTRLTIKNLLQLQQGSVVELDGLAGEPMDIYVNGYLIAQGEVVVVEERYGIRLTDIITPSERISRLNRR